MHPKQLREQHQAVIETLAAELTSGRVQALTAHLGSAHRLRTYSLSNRLLIAMQAPGARHVMSRTAWEALEHTLKDTAAPIFILAPCMGRRDHDPDEAPQDTSKARPAYYRAAKVYRIEDTLKGGLPVTDPGGPVQFGFDNFLALTRLRQACPYPLHWASVPWPVLHGDGSLTVPDHQNSVGDDVFHILWAWSLAIVRSDHPRGEDDHVLAESLLAATAVAESMGVQAVQASSDLIVQVWGGKPRKLKGSIDRALTAAQTLEETLRDAPIAVLPPAAPVFIQTT